MGFLPGKVKCFLEESVGFLVARVDEDKPLDGLNFSRDDDDCFLGVKCSWAGNSFANDGPFHDFSQGLLLGFLSN